MKLTFDELVAAVEALPPEEQRALVRRVWPSTNGETARFTREQALTELDALRAAGAFTAAASLMDRYAGQGAAVTAAELAAALDEAATAWESELDEFDDNGR